MNTIYKITNKMNRKVYVGQTIDLERRKEGHRFSAFNENSSEYHRELYSDIRKFGWESFECEELERCSFEDRLIRENYHIDQLNSNREGYNILGGKDGGSEEYRKKLSEQNQFQGGLLDYEDIVYIRESYLQGKKPSEIYPSFKDIITHYYSFMNIWCGTRYGYVMPEVFEKRPNRVKLSYALASEIRELYSEGELSYDRLAVSYGVGKATIRDVIKNRTWKAEKPVSTISG